VFALLINASITTRKGLNVNNTRKRDRRGRTPGLSDKHAIATQKGLDVALKTLHITKYIPEFMQKKYDNNIIKGNYRC
jgi:hypothetical protein